MRAIEVHSFGGPEVLEVTDLPAPEPGDGEVRIDVTLAGVNYADTHQTEDSYLAPQSLPFIPGAEAAGRAPDGRRVVALLAGGGYAEQCVAPAALCFEIPDSVEDAPACALVLQGTTAWHLLRTSARVAEGETVVVHAAAGGVGSLAVQLARGFGAGRVIATASTAEKRQLALDLGAHVAVDPGDGDLKQALEEANDGRKVDVVLEMVGGEVFDASLAALAPFGRIVCYGMASRRPPRPVQPAALMGRSRAVVGFWLAHCLRRPAMLREAMDDLFARVADGTLRPVVGGVYPLSEARLAHEDLLARRTIGKLLLDPSR